MHLEDNEKNAQINNVSDYLAVTDLCDHDNPWFIKIAEEIIEGAKTPTEKAIHIFYHVRDRVRFGIAYSRSRASQTLKRGYGDCVSKTNVHVALLRAQGIPARFRMAKVESMTLHHLIADFVYNQMPPTASHFWPECFLNEKWISCEAFFDKPLYEGMLKRGLISEEQVHTIEWDGETNLIVLEAWITEHLGSVPSADEVVAGLQISDEGMPPLWVEKIIAPVFYPYNLRYSDKIRKLAQ